jgi:hypothetical protein
MHVTGIAGVSGGLASDAAGALSDAIPPEDVFFLARLPFQELMVFHSGLKTVKTLKTVALCPRLAAEFIRSTSCSIPL